MRDGDRTARSRLGTFYANAPGKRRTLFRRGQVTGRTKQPTAVEVERMLVFTAVGEGEKWELDGIVWKTTVGG